MPRSRAIPSARAVDRERQVAQLGGALGADGGHDGVVRDVLVVVAELGLGGRREDRLGQPAAVLEPGRQRDAADLAGRAVVEQPGPGEVAAGDALDGVHREPLAHDRPAAYGVRDVGR